MTPANTNMNKMKKLSPVSFPSISDPLMHVEPHAAVGGAAALGARWRRFEKGARLRVHVQLSTEWAPNYNTS